MSENNGFTTENLNNVSMHREDPVMESVRNKRPLTTDELLMKCLEDNPNLTFEQRKSIYDGVNIIKGFLKGALKIDLDLIDIIEAGILSSFKFIDVQEADSYYSYSKENNTLTRKKTNDEYMIYDFYESLFKMISQRYNSNTKKYQSGLLIEDEKGIYNNVINDELISRLTTLVTGYSDRKRKDFIDKMDGTCIKDTVINDMCDIIGLENLIVKFITANGDTVFDYLSEKIGVEQTVDFISIIDKSVKVEDNDDEHKIKIANRQKYDMYVTLLKDLNLENIQSL